MLISKDFIFFELQKTGCTHTKNILASLGDHTIIGEHNAYDTVPSESFGNFEEKIKIGNIRNPWDWYVSLWAYGCMHKGALYHLVALRPVRYTLKGLRSYVKTIFGIAPKYLPSGNWRQVYSNPDNVDNFRQWLRMVLEDEEYSIGEGYKESAIFSEAGLLTYRYLKLFTYHGAEVNKDRFYGSLEEYDREQNFMGLIVKNESIHDDLMENADLLGVKPEFLQMVLEGFTKKTNTSKRNKDYRLYYDKESEILVREKDKLIIDKFGYTF